MLHRVRVKPIDSVFRRGSEYDAKIARVSVLYEDLRLENIAASEAELPRLDGSGREFRQLYFIRRSIGTVREFAEAIAMLDSDEEFKALKAGFDADATRTWSKGVRFFARWNRYLRDVRNDVGGHFGYPPARFAIDNLSDGPVVFEYSIDHANRKANVRLKFASEIVAIGMRRHPRAESSKDHFRLLFRLALAAFGRAAGCARLLAVYDLRVRFEPR